MSKPNKNNKFEEAIKAMLSDIENIQGFVSGEILKYTQSKGVLPLTTEKDFQEQKNSLLNADPESPENKGKPVLSFKATQRGIEQKIQSLKNDRAPEIELEKVLTKFQKTKEDLSEKLSTDEGIKEVVEKRLISQALMNKASFLVEDKKTKENRFLVPDEKENIIKTLGKKISLSREVLEILVNPKKSNFYKKFEDNLDKNMKESFAKKMNENDIVPLLKDGTSLSENNLKQFSDLMQKDTSSLITASKLVDLVTQKFEEKNKTLSPETQGKFTEIALNVMKNVPPEYIEKNMSKIANVMVKQIDEKKTFLSSFRKDLKISSSEIDIITKEVKESFREDLSKYIQNEGKNLVNKMVSPKDKSNLLETEQKTEPNKRPLPSLALNLKQIAVKEAKNIHDHLPSQQKNTPKQMEKPSSLKTPNITKSGWVKS